MHLVLVSQGFRAVSPILSLNYCYYDPLKHSISTILLYGLDSNYSQKTVKILSSKSFSEVICLSGRVYDLHASDRSEKHECFGGCVSLRDDGVLLLFVSRLLVQKTVSI